MNNHLRIWKPIILAGALGLILLLGPDPIVLTHGAAKCPPGSTLVEDIVSGKIICERRDSMSTRSLGVGAEEPQAPGRPEAPGKPEAPGAPEEPWWVPSEKPECELSHWGCQQSCQQTYLSSATDPAPNSAQRAKVILGACIKVCAEEFSCPAHEPETP